MRKQPKKPGISYAKKVAEINRIYDRYAPSGMSNRSIWARFVYPLYGISERTFYNILKAEGAAGTSCGGAQPSIPGLTDTENE